MLLGTPGRLAPVDAAGDDGLSFLKGGADAIQVRLVSEPLPSRFGYVRLVSEARGLVSELRRLRRRIDYGITWWASGAHPSFFLKSGPLHPLKKYQLRFSDVSNNFKFN